MKDKPEKICAYKEPDGSCAHPNKTRSCCNMEPDPTLVAEFVEQNPEFQHSDLLCEDAKLICYGCCKRVSYLFDDGRCSKCTRLTPKEVTGEAD